MENHAVRRICIRILRIEGSHYKLRHKSLNKIILNYSLPLWGFSGITKQIIQMSITWLRVSTRWRPTGWLFNKRGRGFELGTSQCDYGNQYQ